MTSPTAWQVTKRSCGAAACLVTVSLLSATAAWAAADPCKLVTEAEMQQIVGPLKGAPKASNPASGELTCSYTPAKGPSFIDVSLHDGDLAHWRQRNGGTSPVALPEFGKDAFVNPDFHDMADLYAKKGSLILRVTLPKNSQAVDLVKSIAKKALARM